MFFLFFFLCFVLFCFVLSCFVYFLFFDFLDRNAFEPTCFLCNVLEPGISTIIVVYVPQQVRWNTNTKQSDCKTALDEAEKNKITK